jgi:hypothetical protein
MNVRRFRGMTDIELVDEFEQLCLAQDAALDREEFAAYGRRYKVIQALMDELKARSGDRRRLLKKFFGQGNFQVRLTAAHAVLALDYEEARREMELIAESQWQPQAGYAGMSLWNLDRGVYRPT